MRLPGNITGILGGTLVLAVWWSARNDSFEKSPGTSPVANPVVATASFKPDGRALGVASCAATACHGNPASSLSSPPIELADLRPVDCWKSSYLQWTNLDKHAQAFEVLKNERSHGIERRLSQDKINAWEDTRCLACHVNPTLAARRDPEATALHRDGVSCEACHGNAKPWRWAHTAWTSATDREKSYADSKMTKLFDVGIRAETCAGCHVGAPASADAPLRDVNHELIAAGHPRFNFDFASYSRRMPPHWREKDRLHEGKPRPAGFESQFWQIGQAVCAESSLSLLKARAELPKKDGEPARWPELAEFNCFACHHDLNGWRTQQGRLGKLIWNSPSAFVNAGDDLLLMQALKKTANVESKLFGDPEAIIRATDEATTGWRRWRVSILERATDEERLRTVIRQMRLDEAQWAALDWDHAAWLYSAIGAIENTRRDQRRAPDKDAEGILLRLNELLRLPREPVRFDSPKDYAPGQVRDTLRQWFALPINAPSRKRRRPSLS